MARWKASQSSQPEEGSKLAHRSSNTNARIASPCTIWTLPAFVRIISDTERPWEIFKAVLKTRKSSEPE